MNGNRTDVKSTSGARTREPSGTDAATIPMSVDTLAAMATDPTPTPDETRERSARVLARNPQCSQLVRPPRQSSSAACSASHAAVGGSPYEAVFRYVPTGFQSPCASTTSIEGV